MHMHACTHIEVCIHTLREVDVKSLGLAAEDARELNTLVQNMVDGLRPVYPEGGVFRVSVCMYVCVCVCMCVYVCEYVCVCVCE